MTFALAPLNHTRILLRNRLIDDLVVIDLQLPLLVGSLKSVLELTCNPLLAKLLFHSVDDRHDTLDVTIEDIADLQALERDLTIILFWALVRRDDRETSIGHIGNDRGEVLVRGDVGRPRVPRAHVEFCIELCGWQSDFAGHEPPLGSPSRRVAPLQSASALHALRFLSVVHGVALGFIVLLRRNSLVLRRRSQVADGGDEVFYRSNRCL